ncbi:phage regulatory CII family protein [Vibrio europaeus]|uniref:phage regulatory CII family protein n=1 Tax=Vibrio europaeus TaxID=300876 RepID=UPI0023413C87|nr:phage regulatory CII family protein [Vibrio europaeus]MDC5842155.1 phage regulatory CII family protein [Vibrio europaeus]
MNDIDLKCDFIGSKQKAFNEACCAFARTENMARLAERLGMSSTMLRNKLNPEQPHVLSCTELITISKISGNHSIVNALLIGLGVVTALIPPDKTEATLLRRAIDNAIYSGELSRMALDCVGKQELSRTMKHKIVQTAQASISNHVLIINSLEKLNQDVSPCMEIESVVRAG